MYEEPLERQPAFVAAARESAATTNFKLDWRNEYFRPSVMTWMTLVFLVILFPGANFIFSEDPVTMLESLDDTLRLILFVATIVVQWLIFLFVFGTVYTENTGLAGIGFKRIRLLDFFWAIAFFGVAALLLAGLAAVLAYFGMPTLGEIKFLVPQDTTGRIVWVFLSFTAGFCEEAAFRGFLMTRLRLVGKFQSWLFPTLISAVVFGSLHIYQGLPGFILITVYGILFSLLFIYTKSIWPGIIAHSLQDLLALFIPQ